MVGGSLTVKTMGDLEMIEPSGLRATFTDKGVALDIVPLSECCEMCNDPRMLTIDGVRKCVSCECVNHIDYGFHA
jgi:hypothetical protein